jgi:hypothetical protein
MVGMIKRPIGVWFSVALAILVSGAWVSASVECEVIPYAVHAQ